MSTIDINKLQQLTTANEDLDKKYGCPGTASREIGRAHV